MNYRFNIKMVLIIYPENDKKQVFLKISQNVQENTCAEVLVFNKFERLQTATLFNERLQHRCFPVNFAKLLIQITFNFSKTPQTHVTYAKSSTNATNVSFFEPCQNFMDPGLPGHPSENLTNVTLELTRLCYPRYPRCHTGHPRYLTDSFLQYDL